MLLYVLSLILGVISIVIIGQVIISKVNISIVEVSLKLKGFITKKAIYELCLENGKLHREIFYSENEKSLFLSF